MKKRLYKRFGFLRGWRRWGKTWKCPKCDSNAINDPDIRYNTPRFCPACGRSFQIKIETYYRKWKYKNK